MMAEMAFFVLTAAQSVTAQSLDNDGNARIAPRAIDGALPGVGVNMSDVANGIPVGASVPLTGMYVAPKRIVDDPMYQQLCPNLITFLLTLPWCSVVTETVFAPVVLD